MTTKSCHDILVIVKEVSMEYPMMRPEHLMSDLNVGFYASRIALGQHISLQEIAEKRYGDPRTMDANAYVEQMLDNGQDPREKAEAVMELLGGYWSGYVDIKGDTATMIDRPDLPPIHLM